MNWLGDSEPNFPAQISGFLYAQFYATSMSGTRFGIFALGECPRWEAPNRCRPGAQESCGIPDGHPDWSRRKRNSFMRPNSESRFPT
jgi:hypothetical protein